jgi:myo-inositol-1(or 4)-monophosphatase
MSSPPFAAELRLAVAAAAEAAEILVRGAGARPVREKGRADLVTAVDEAAERAIVRAIGDVFPEDVIVGEEFSGFLGLGERTWIVDPVDGTANFVHGHPFSCVSIGFVDREGPAVGVIHAPFLSEIYHGARGQGAHLNGTQIRVSQVEEGSRSLFATGFPFKAGKGDPETYFQLVSDVMLGSHDIRRAGSAALDLAYVAAGRHEGYFEIGVSVWDIAAGVLLVREAGGVVTGWPGDVEGPLSTGRILATNGLVHGWLEEHVARYDL